jgi:LPXTG-motif cell wall-anchored protein
MKRAMVLPFGVMAMLLALAGEASAGVDCGYPPNRGSECQSPGTGTTDPGSGSGATDPGSGSGATPPGSGSAAALAQTGSNTGDLVAAGAILVGVGGLLVVATRRRAATSNPAA